MNPQQRQHRTERFRIELWEPGRTLPGVDAYFVDRFRTESHDTRPIDSERRFNEYCRMAASVWSQTLQGKLPLTSRTYDLLSNRITSSRGFLIEFPVERYSWGGIVVREDNTFKAGIMPWDVVLRRGGYTGLERTPSPRIGLLPRLPVAGVSPPASSAHSFEVQEGAVLFLVAGAKQAYHQDLRPQLLLAAERIEIPFDTAYAIIGLEPSVVTQDSKRVTYQRHSEDRQVVFASTYGQFL